jgi:hypothetical protein
MKFAQLSAVQQRIHVGTPLPFNVRDADRSLLLARGQIVDSHEQMRALLERGALVDLGELRSGVAGAAGVAAVADAPPERLPALWRDCMVGVGDALKASPHPGYTAAIRDASAPVVALIERDPDLAIFQVLRQDGSRHVQYGINHSVHAAIAVHLVAQRVGWDAGATQTAFKAALTMNIAMLELQGQLATQVEPVTQEQHDAIHSHPQRSVEMLELAGVTDRDWLDAVAQHHEVPGGIGYPAGLTDVDEMASLVRRADVYTAKLSGRFNRDAMAADQAGRQMFMQDPGHPMTAALAKEFGLYPPGCHVALANGEMGIVVRRGPTVTTPLVASLTNHRGVALNEPLFRDTGAYGQAIVGVVPDHAMRTRIVPERMMRLLAA